MNIVYCFRGQVMGRPHMGFATPAAVPMNDLCVRETVELCGSCRNRAAVENARAQSRRRGPDSDLPGFTQ